jgi:phosphatidylinositol-3,4,5-trisphosphate 3-phosphatase and dual-specificity protein phosphatase PTEN
MMNWLRCKVSGKRNRYKEEGYNLDITYITDNILAMSFPASGMESVYRNQISKVAEFLDDKHPDSYRVINLSNRAYNSAKFHGKVDSYAWEDHHSPSINVIFE